MKLNVKKIFPVLMLPLSLLAFSCSSVDENAQNGYVEITVKRTSSGNTDGYQTFKFAVPPNGSDKVYAGKTTADDNANVDQYIINALSATDVPFNAVEVHVMPEKNSEGESYAAKATVRIAQYDEGYESSNTGFFWTITASDHGLSNDNYSVPMAKGGIFTFDFQTSDDDGVYETGYNNNTSNYPLLSIKVAAPVKKY